MQEERPLRFLLVHNEYREPGGESAVFAAEAEGLSRAGHPVSLYTRSNLELDGAGAAARAGAVLASFHARSTVRDIRRLVEDERPDVALVQNVFPLISPSVYGALRALGVPVIQAVYNYRFICPDAHLYSKGEICERCVGGNHVSCVLRRCYRDSTAASAWYAALLWVHRRLGTFVDQIDRYLVPDRFLGEKLAQGGLPADRIRVAPNPFFADRYRPVESHEGYVLYVGRLIPQKGVLTLLAAMRREAARLPLVIVGQGELEATIVAALAADPLLGARVQFRGALWGEEAARVIAGAAALVVPSEWYDNLPQVLCQANAMGKPVIASRIDGIPEYVADGENGFLFEPGRADQLADAIARVAALDAPAYAALARRTSEHARRVFDYPRHYACLMATAREIVRTERA